MENIKSYLHSQEPREKTARNEKYLPADNRPTVDIGDLIQRLKIQIDMELNNQSF